MAIKRTHRTGCDGGDCKCPWLLDYRPLGVKGPRRMLQFPTKRAAERHRDSTMVKARHGEYVDPEKRRHLKPLLKCGFFRKRIGARRTSLIYDRGSTSTYFRDSALCGSIT